MCPDAKFIIAAGKDVLVAKIKIYASGIVVGESASHGPQSEHGDAQCEQAVHCLFLLR